MNTMRLIPKTWFKRDGECCGNRPRHMQSFTSGVPLYVELDKLFNSFFNNMMPRGDNGEHAEGDFLRPKVDVSGTEQHYIVTVEMPGVDENDIRVELENGALRIHGEKRRELEEKSRADDKDAAAGTDDKGDKNDKDAATTYRLERSYGSFQRTLTLPDDVDAAGITAAHKNGVLTITLPRAEVAKPEARQIAIDKG